MKIVFELSCGRRVEREITSSWSQEVADARFVALVTSDATDLLKEVLSKHISDLVTPSFVRSALDELEK